MHRVEKVQGILVHWLVISMSQKGWPWKRGRGERPWKRKMEGKRHYVIRAELCYNKGTKGKESINRSVLVEILLPVVHFPVVLAVLYVCSLCFLVI